MHWANEAGALNVELQILGSLNILFQTKLKVTLSRFMITIDALRQVLHSTCSDYSLKVLSRTMA